MCEVPSRINIKVQMQPPATSRKGSSTSCRSSRRGGSQSARCSSSASGLPVPDCMRPSRIKPCCNEPRPDCCQNIPCCAPPLPKCPLGIYVERVQPIRPDRKYEPPTFPFEALSSYREAYFLKCGDRSKSFKPLSTFDPSTARMDGLSTYREAYTPKPICSYQKPPWSKAAQFEPSGSKMDGISTYRVDYNGCMGERSRSVKPTTTFDPSTAKMDGITTYRVNYIPYCSREYDYARQAPYKKQVTAAFSCAPMEGVSTYRSDFWPKCCAKRRSLKPSIKARFSDSKFADRTTYRNDFNPFHFEKCVGECIPALVYDEMFPDCANFACGADPERRGRQDDGDSNCVGGGQRPRPLPGSCGNEMGLMPGQPLPECCQLDEAPEGEGGDC